jgi:hypothetical protein
MKPLDWRHWALIAALAYAAWWIKDLREYEKAYAYKLDSP